MKKKEHQTTTTTKQHARLMICHMVRQHLAKLVADKTARERERETECGRGKVTGERNERNMSKERKKQQRGGEGVTSVNSSRCDVSIAHSFSSTGWQ